MLLKKITHEQPLHPYVDTHTPTYQSKARSITMRNYSFFQETSFQPKNRETLATRDTLRIGHNIDGTHTRKNKKNDNANHRNQAPATKR